MKVSSHENFQIYGSPQFCINFVDSFAKQREGLEAKCSASSTL